MRSPAALTFEAVVMLRGVAASWPISIRERGKSVSRRSGMLLEEQPLQLVCRLGDGELFFARILAGGFVGVGVGELQHGCVGARVEPDLRTSRHSRDQRPDFLEFFTSPMSGGADRGLTGCCFYGMRSPRASTTRNAPAGPTT